MLTFAPQSLSSAGSASSGPLNLVPALPIGHRVGDVLIQEVLHLGVTSVVYRALDLRQNALVALKEYLPSELALRQSDGSLGGRPGRLGGAYQAGLAAFVSEARLLQDLVHEALVKVQRWWEEAGTAYMVMDLMQGKSLRHWLADLGTAPSEGWLRQLLPPLMDSLEGMHAAGIRHQSVTPDKILMRFDPAAGSYLDQKPQPVLLGMGCASRAIGLALANPAMDLLEGGFASIEQSDGVITARQGAWTDVYGLCAVLYCAIAGRSPPPSLHRAAQDDMVSARKVGRGRYSSDFLAAVDAGLMVQPQERLQSMQELRQLLVQPEPVELPLPAAGATQSIGRTPLWVWPALSGALLLLAAAVGGLLQR